MTLDTDISEAQRLLQAGQYKQAHKQARTMIRQHPKSPVPLNLAGVALGALQKPREALDMFTRAARLDPAFHDARKNLAQTYLVLGQADKAQKLLVPLSAAMPGDFGVWYLLAQARAATGQTAAAIAAATSAIAIAPRQASGYRLRALLRVQNGRIGEAIEDYEAALEIAPEDVDTLTNISLPLARHLRSDDALARVRRAVELAPGHIPARVRLAMQLSEMGRTEDAIAEYRRILSLEPGQADAIERLSQLLPSDQTEEIAAQARTALKSASRGGEARAALNYALALIERGQGNEEEAARQLAQANRDMARLLPYDGAADRALHDQLKARFAEPFAPGDTATAATPVPIFVVGLPRSGTTLVEAMLGRHPEVVALGERAEPGFLLKPLIDSGLPFDAAAIAEFIDEDRRLLPQPAQQARAYVDKMPENYRLTGFLKAAYPHCRIVNVRRDPRDVALSMWQAHFSGAALSYTYDLAAMAQRFNLYGAMMAHWHRVLEGAILDLRYEDVVADVTAASRTLAQFCDLEWVPEMAEPHLGEGQVLTLSANQLRRPVHARSVGRWKAHEAELAEFMAGLDPQVWPEIAQS